MRGTPTLRGWCPTRWWHMKRQQFLDRPAMIRDASGHRRCGPAHRRGPDSHAACRNCRPSRSDTCHAAASGCGAPAPGNGVPAGQAFPERRVQPLDVRRIDHPVPLRPASERLHACRRAIDNAAFGLDHPPPLVALDDLGDQDMAPRTKPGPSTLPVCTGSRKVSRMARM